MTNGYARFNSTFVSENGLRPTKVDRVPPEVMTNIGTPADRNWWFPLWVKSGGSWANVQYSEILAINDKSVEGVTYEWLTRKQIIAIYHDGDIGNAIADEKLQHPTANKRNPDVPWLDAARLFLVRT